MLTDEMMIDQLQGMGYEQVLTLWRREPPGSPWFCGKVGDAMVKRYSELRNKTPASEAVAISKRVGW